jgi:hypothetical protein
VCGVVSAAAVVGLRQQTLAAIRRDIREGRSGGK